MLFVEHDEAFVNDIANESVQDQFESITLFAAAFRLLRDWSRTVNYKKRSIVIRQCSCSLFWFNLCVDFCLYRGIIYRSSNSRDDQRRTYA